MANIYDSSGNIIDVSGGGESQINYDLIVKSVNHRGYNTVAPENTLPAFKLSKQYGYNYVETDVSWTSDSVAVLSHNDDISICSDGTGNISQMTYEQLLQYDFSNGKAGYSNVKIPTAEEFLKLCRAIGLHPYLELKNGVNETRVAALVDLVEACGMKGNVTYISFYSQRLGWVKTADPSARLGYLPATSMSASEVTTAQSLQTETNEVFFDCDALYNKTAAVFQYAIDAGIPVELWTVDNTTTIQNANPYVTGFTTNSTIAGKVLYDANIN